MLAVKGGDQRAFAQLFDKYSRAIVNFAFRFVGDRARAEELAQDVFMKIYRSATSYQPNARFKTFLFRVAANHCMNERRRGIYQSAHTSTEEAGVGNSVELVSTDNNSPEQALAGHQLENAVSAALDALTPRERVAFSLCRFEGMAYKDIAESLETSEAAVKSLIHRATLSVTRHLASVQQTSENTSNVPQAKEVGHVH
jgi:RNA polymerase sigma-70 factor (ECF subfamily)